MGVGAHYFYFVALSLLKCRGISPEEEMMKGSKYLLLLAAFMVGFGLVGGAQAATVSSIAVTSPDSGAIRGIDSTFVVTAKVLDLSPVDSL